MNSSDNQMTGNMNMNAFSFNANSVNQPMGQMNINQGSFNFNNEPTNMKAPSMDFKM